MAYNFVQIKPPFDIQVNFWKANFQVSLIEPFRSLYLRDESENKEVSSREMWCIWLDQDPNYYNKIFRMPIEEKHSAIQAFNPEFNFDDPLVATCLIEYSNHCLSPAAKAFMEEERSLVERSIFISESRYTFDEIAKDRTGSPMYTKQGSPIIIKGTATTIDGMRKATLDIMARYEQVKKTFEEEQHMLRIYGGGKESLSESSGFSPIVDDDEDDDLAIATLDVITEDE